MMKRKAVYRFLVPILVAGIVMSPLNAIERVEASGVTNVWVELSDATVLNSTSTALEYIIHFTTTTALTGGVDTITVAFPDGTTELAGEESSGCTFTLPSSIDKAYVAVDPDGAATTTIGYTDCYTDPDAGTYRVRLTVPEDIAAGASLYVKLEAGASVTVSNPGGNGDNITDRVTYYEWLYKPIADVIADNAAYYSRVVSLSVGWNTLSTPIILDASGDTVDEVVDQAKITIAYWYDTSDADADGTYWEQVTTGYRLEPCDAIYIKMNATDNVLLKYNAVDVSTPTKDLYDGWNLIGLANLETKHVDDTVQSVANTSTNLPGYSQVVSPSMNSADWTYSSGQSYTNQDMLVGEGYWIYMQNDCTLAGFTITPIQPSLD